MKNKPYILIVLIMTLFRIALPQNDDSNKIIEKVKQNFLTVKDYEVNAQIKVDIDFLKVPVTNAKIYFKQPDKVKISSEGFAMLPKEGINFSPITILKGNNTIIYDKDDVLNGYNVSVIKIIPSNEAQNIVLSTLWIDKGSNVIRKIESATKFNGIFTIDLQYDKNITSYPLPSQLVFTFDANRSFIPLSLDRKQDNKQQDNKEKKSSKGVVTITYSNYKVNTGLSDEFFNEEKKDK
jgi:outer membrane lipoprotein-sorting protein